MMVQPGNANGIVNGHIFLSLYIFICVSVCVYTDDMCDIQLVFIFKSLQSLAEYIISIWLLDLMLYVIRIQWICWSQVCVNNSSFIEIFCGKSAQFIILFKPVDKHEMLYVHPPSHWSTWAVRKTFCRHTFNRKIVYSAICLVQKFKTKTHLKRHKKKKRLKCTFFLLSHSLFVLLIFNSNVTFYCLLTKYTNWWGISLSTFHSFSHSLFMWHLVETTWKARSFTINFWIEIRFRYTSCHAIIPQLLHPHHHYINI